MKFRLISRQGVDEGTGEIPTPFAGPLMVIVWTGRTFIKDAETQAGQDPNWLETDEEWFYEALGEAIEFRQVTPPPKAAVRWTSPTALGRMAEKAPAVVDSVAPGYVYEANPPPPRMPADGERCGDLIETVPDCSQPDAHPSVIPPRRRRGEPS